MGGAGGLVGQGKRVEIVEADPQIVLHHLVYTMLVLVCRRLTGWPKSRESGRPSNQREERYRWMDCVSGI